MYTIFLQAAIILILRSRKQIFIFLQNRTYKQLLNLWRPCILYLNKDPFILQRVSELYVHTPLHEASIYGKVDMALKLMILAPSYAIKLNTHGFSPSHLAVENCQVEIAIELVNVDSSCLSSRQRRYISIIQFYNSYVSFRQQVLI